MDTSTSASTSSNMMVSIDFNQFPIDSFRFLRETLQHCGNLPDQMLVIDEILSAFALYVYHALWWIDHSRNRTDRSGRNIPYRRSQLEKTIARHWRHSYEYSEEIDFRQQLRSALNDRQMNFLFKTLELVTGRVDIKGISKISERAKLGEPDVVKVLEGARKWLLACLAAPGLRIDPTQLKQSQAFWKESDQQPRVDQNRICNFRQQLQNRHAGGFGLWPDLTRLLQVFIPAQDSPWSEGQGHDITLAMTFLLQFAHTIHTAHRYRVSLQPQPHDVPPRSWEELILKIEDSWACRLANPVSSMSPRVRKALAEMNFLGNWNFIHHFVMPNMRPPRVEFFFVYHWIMAAACHPDVDGSRKLKSYLATQFDLSYLEHIPSPLTRREDKSYDLGLIKDISGNWFLNTWELYCPLSDERNIEILARRAANARVARIKLAARTPRLRPDLDIASLNQWNNDVAFPRDDWANDPLLDFDLSAIPPKPSSKLSTALAPFTHALSNPSPDDNECVICRDDFEEIPGISPNICHHTYHLKCLSS